MFIITKKQQTIINIWCLDHKKFQGIDWRKECDNLTLQSLELEYLNGANHYVQTLRNYIPHLLEGNMLW